MLRLGDAPYAWEVWREDDKLVRGLATVAAREL